MYTYTVLFIDKTTATVRADDIDEAYFKAMDTFRKQIIDIWCD